MAAEEIPERARRVAAALLGELDRLRRDRGVSKAAAYDYGADQEKLQALILGRGGAPGRGVPRAAAEPPAPAPAARSAPAAQPSDPAVRAWLLSYRAEAARLSAAAERLRAEQTPAACAGLGAVVEGARIPHAPRAAIEREAAAALTWLARAAASCRGGYKDATSLRLERASEAFASVDAQ